MLNDLNPAQKEAVLHPKGPLLILAGAGSGKTRALTYRAAYLLSELKVPPERILLTTFTNKAAHEMQERLKNLTGLKLPFAGTFHSLCARILRRHGGEIGIAPSYLIYDVKDQLEALKVVYRELNIDPKETRPQSVLYSIEGAKQELIGPAEYASFARGPHQQTIAKAYRAYQNLLREYSALDFNDLLFEAVRLFTDVPQVRETYEEQFLHVLVDEYQDTNKAQYQLTKYFGSKHRNICVVGDASQAIYSWRGADYRNLSLLEQDFPDLTTIKLEQNYRSTQTILDAAYGVIAHNKLHPILSLWTEAPAGDKVAVYEAENEYAEAKYILQEISAYQAETGAEINQNAVLYRTNAQSRVLEEAFMRAGVPYVLVGGVKFYERREVKDVLAYMRLSYNRRDQVSQTRIEKLGKRRMLKYSLWLEEADLTKSPREILDQILAVTDYLSKFDEKDPEEAMRIENVKELRSVAEGFSTLGEFLENVALVEQDTKSAGYVTPEGGAKTPPTKAVVFMTLHASKGLEFDQVFMVGMEEGLFPHSRSLLEAAELEEERRLCYVGMTRARKKLHLTYAKNRLYFGSRTQNMVSRFVGEVPVELTNATKAAPVVISPLEQEQLDRFLDGEMDIDEFLES